MNRYILLTPTIGNMGGSQMFVSNKYNFLRSLGWEVSAFFYQDYEIILDNLKTIKGKYIPDLKYGFYYLPKKRRQKVIDRICEGISKDDTVVVESHMYHLTFWGELIAKQLRGKHIMNRLEEERHILNDHEVNFFEYKLKRWECLNASFEALHRVFGSHYKKEYSNYQFDMIPLCSNVVSNIKDDSYELKKSDYNIMSIGRLDKPYIFAMVKEIKDFINSYSQYKYNILFIGGSPEGTVENRISSFFQGFDNVNLYFFGFMFPVPSNLIKIADVVIATSNSVLVGANQGIPSISIDTDDHYAIGIFNHTTTNTLNRTNEPRINISALLKDILIDKIYVKNTIIQNDGENELEEAFAPQVDFLSKSPNDLQYYDVASIYGPVTYVIANTKRLGHILLKR